ncbi:hypothetical protein POM88_040055 [Heracleum sosnowskyi]|uniref:Uncharacterized protein n=1 Tax=Heracleum sosnowskyi TaxID=360622 RepID=A0AAD8HCB6_9APIA|nr:hypothetical protein POM88_040055 [Heracleum sosnowskyi]
MLDLPKLKVLQVGFFVCYIGLVIFYELGIRLDGVTTVLAGEVPSSYNFDPRSDILAQVTGFSQASLQLVLFMDGSMGKKKRGRPRRYGPEAHTLSTSQVSTSPPPAASFRDFI